MPDTFHTLCPVVRREKMRLFERVEVANEYRFFPFDQEILWVRESSTKLTYMHKGVDITDGPSFNDFHGFLTSFTGAITDDIVSIGKSLGLEPTSDLYIQADVSIHDIPCIEDTSREGIAHNAKWDRKQYITVPSYYNGKKWWFTSDQPIDPTDEYSRRPTLERVEVATQVYSTLGQKKLGVIPDVLQQWIDLQKAAAQPILATPPIRG